MLRRGLKDIDFYKSVPSHYKEGTVAGACISIISISALLILVVSSVATYFTPVRINDLIIDQKHVEESLKVSIDIQFPSIPCSILSLDIENILGVHQVNIGGSIKKYELPSGGEYIDAGLDSAKKIQAIKQHFKSKSGCRMNGSFQIDRVPGNFHFSNHGYNYQTMQAMNPLPMFDFSHRMKHMYFGEQQPTEAIESSLSKYKSQKQIVENFLGISYLYFLQIIPKNTINSDGYHKESYYYSARINEMILGSVPLVYFKYQTSPIIELEIGEYIDFQTLLIQLIAIIGGIFTVASIVDQMIHTSIHFLIRKHQMGKLM